MSYSSKVHRGFWFLRLFLMCASLAGVLLAIEHLNHTRITFEPLTGAHATTKTETGITAKVIRDTASVPEKSAGETQPVDKNPASH